MSLNTVYPIMRFSMCMGHSDNHDRVAVDAVNQGIREAYEETSSHLRFDYRRGVRISLNKSNGAIERVQKVQTLTFLSFFKPNDSIINFLLSEREESDVHLLLYLLSNSSYERLAMFPAL